MPDLKLIALDPDDLSIISAHLQDAVLKVSDIVYLPKEKRFAALTNRFDWLEALKDGRNGHEELARRQAALRFERVLGAQVNSIDLNNKGAVLSLLAIGFEPADEPEGDVMLLFAGGGAIKLRVECIEAELKDLGPVWQAKGKPEHTEDQA